MIKSILLHLSMNMWEDNMPASYLLPNDGAKWQKQMPEHYMRMPGYLKDRAWCDTLQLDHDFWRLLVKKCADCGLNAIFLDVGDGIVFRSHPEIAVGGAWTPLQLKEELAFCRDLGLKVYPKLNFSSSHDAWMRQYSHMLSTPVYYQFCKDVIAETAELFEGPEHFHIGMDEETAAHQKLHNFVVVRQNNLWWNDLNFYFDEVGKTGARPWMWSDKLWHMEDPADFFRFVPRTVVQNNWYYRLDYKFEGELDDVMLRRKKIVETFTTLDKAGYDQVPAGSTWATPYNYEKLVPYCTKNISKKHLLGFMTAPWVTTEPHNRESLFESCDQMYRAHAKGKK